MKVATAIVGTDERRFRTVSANKERLALSQQIAAATKRGIDLVVLPAGFMAAANVEDVPVRAREVAKLFRHCHLVAGIDLDRGRLGRRGKLSGYAGKAEFVAKDAAKPGSRGLGFWSFMADHGHVKNIWQQRSTHSGQRVADASAQTFNVGRKKVGVLTCGELFNRMLGDSLAEAGLDLVLDIAHQSMTRFTKSLHRVSKTVDCEVLHVQHVALHSDGNSWRATSKGALRNSTPDWASYDDTWDDELWAHLTVSTV